MTNPLLPVLDPTRDAVVEACAGSGKTWFAGVAHDPDGWLIDLALLTTLRLEVCQQHR